MHKYSAHRILLLFAVNKAIDAYFIVTYIQIGGNFFSKRHEQPILTGFGAI